MFSTTHKIKEYLTPSFKKRKISGEGVLDEEEKTPYELLENTFQEEEGHEEEKDIPHESSSYHFQLKMFQNGDAPIAYKENFVNGKANPFDLTYKIMQKREQALRPDKNHRVLECHHRVRESKNYKGLSLEKSPEGKWVIKDNMNNQLFEPEAGVPYIFVTMPSGTIRISTRGENGHVTLSGIARYVRYAGEVIFDKNQKIVLWNNASYSYSPSPFLAFQANFQEGTRFFSKKIDRNDPELEIAPAFLKKH